MRGLIFFCFILILLPLTEAYADTLSVDTCGSDDYPTRLEGDVCGKLKGSDNFNDLSENESKRIILDMLTEGETTVQQKHDFVESWSELLNISVDTPTEGPAAVKNGAVQNVWVRTFSVYPTYEDEGVVYTTGAGTVMSGYNYNIVRVPNNFNGGTKVCEEERRHNRDKYDNPYKFAGHGNCKTNYLVADDKSRFYLYVNNVQIPINGLKGVENGTKVLTEFEKDSEVYTFESKLDAYYYVKTEEWEWRVIGDDCCHEECEDDDCWCEDDRYTCVERYEDDNVHEYNYRQTISHSFDMPVEKYHKPEPPYSTQVIIVDKDTTPVVEVKTDAPNFKLQMGQATLAQYKDQYTVDWSYPPYNGLQVVKVNGSTVKLGNDIVMLDSEEGTTKFSVDKKNVESCYITYFYPLGGEESTPCNEVKKYSPKLKISVDEAVYDKDQKINVGVELSRQDNSEQGNVKVSYCDQTKEVYVLGSDSVGFNAVRGCGLITAAYSDEDLGDVEDSIRISVKEDNTLIISLVIAFGFIFVIAKFVWTYFWRQVV